MYLELSDLGAPISVIITTSISIPMTLLHWALEVAPLPTLNSPFIIFGMTVCIRNSG